MPDGGLSVNAPRLAGIPGVLVRGALDLGWPADLLWRLARDWPESELVVIHDEGHRGGAATNAALVHATDTFGKQDQARSWRPNTPTTGRPSWMP